MREKREDGGRPRKPRPRTLLTPGETPEDIHIIPRFWAAVKRLFDSGSTSLPPTKPHSATYATLLLAWARRSRHDARRAFAAGNEIAGQDLLHVAELAEELACTPGQARWAGGDDERYR